MTKRHHRQAIVLTPPISDDSSDREKEGAVRRRLVATTGRCPCGAEMVLPKVLKPGTVTVLSVEHEDGCPAMGEGE
jgi:hypothetical protein